MNKSDVFVSFDIEHDAELYELLVAQSRTPSSGFVVVGGSERLTATDVWSESVRARIREADQVIIICGEHTETSRSMSAEFRIAQQEDKPYLLLWGRRENMCTKPSGAKPAEGMYSWTREILQDQIAFMLRCARADAALQAVPHTAPKG